MRQLEKLRIVYLLVIKCTKACSARFLFHFLLSSSFLSFKIVLKSAGEAMRLLISCSARVSAFQLGKQIDFSPFGHKMIRKRKKKQFDIFYSYLFICFPTRLTSEPSFLHWLPHYWSWAIRWTKLLLTSNYCLSNAQRVRAQNKLHVLEKKPAIRII